MDCAESSKRLSEVLGLEYPPVAVKFLKPGEAIPEGFDAPSRRMRFCQAVMEASWGKSLVVSPMELACGPGPGSFGAPVREKVSKGEVHQALGLFETSEAAARCLNSNTKMMPGAVSAVLVSQLEKCKMNPDTVILKVNPEQAMWICQSRSFSEGRHLVFDLQTEASVCSAIGVGSYLKNEVQIGLGCYGSRSNTEMKAEDMLVGIPTTMLEATVVTLEKLKKPIADSRMKKTFYELYPEKKQPPTK